MSIDRWEAWELKLDIKDFDGDQINMTLCVDKKMADNQETFKPFYNARGMDRPGKVSSNIYISKSIVGSLGQYFAEED